MAFQHGDDDFGGTKLRQMTLSLQHLDNRRASKSVMEIICYYYGHCQVLAALQNMARDGDLQEFRKAV